MHNLIRYYRYKGREELLEKHRLRREGRQKVADMLKILGGDSSSAPSIVSVKVKFLSLRRSF